MLVGMEENKLSEGIVLPNDIVKYSFKLESINTSSNVAGYKWIFDEYFKNCRSYQDFEKACGAYDDEGYDAVPLFKINQGKLYLVVLLENDSYASLAQWDIEMSSSYFWFTE